MTVQYAWHYGYFANVYNKKWQYSTLGIMGIITTCACSKSEPGFPNDIIHWYFLCSMVCGGEVVVRFDGIVDYH